MTRLYYNTKKEGKIKRKYLDVDLFSFLKLNILSSFLLYGLIIMGFMVIGILVFALSYLY